MFDPTKPAQTRGGHPVRIISTNGSEPRPIIFELAGRTYEVYRAKRDGSYVNADVTSSFDLVNVPEELEEVTFYLKVGNSYSYEKPARRQFSDEWPILKVTAKVGPDGLEDIREIVSTEALDG